MPYIVLLYLTIFPLHAICAELYVSPKGKGILCSEDIPCSLNEAIYKAGENQEQDIIKVLPGLYEIEKPIVYDPKGEIENASLIIESTDIKNKPVLKGWDLGTCILEINTLNVPNSNSPNDEGLTVVIKGLIFENGNCYNGGAISAKLNKAVLIIRENMFRNNKANNYGGAIYINGGAEVHIFNNIIYNNTAEKAGGGIYIEGSSSTATSKLYMYNNTIYGNEAQNNLNNGKGGGAYITNVSAQSYIYLFNNIFYGNIAGINEGEDLYIIANGKEFNIANNNFSPNAQTSNIDNDGNLIYTVSSEDVFVKATGNVLLMESNTIYPPFFVNPSIENFRLACGSKLVDSGTLGNWMNASTDFFSETRVEGTSIDIGADEVNFVGSVYTESKNINFGDVDVTIEEKIKGRNLIELKVYNDGCIDLEINKLELKNNKDNIFKIESEDCTDKRVEPGSLNFCTIRLLFKPILDKEYKANLYIHFNNPYESPKIFNISGRGSVPPHLKKPIVIADPNMYDFGSIHIGEHKKVKIIVKNTGYESTQRIDSVSLDNAKDFSIVFDSCKYAIIKPLNQCEIEIAFNPKSSGVKSTKLVFNGEIPVANFYGLALERKKGNCSLTTELWYLSLLVISILLRRKLT